MSPSRLHISWKSSFLYLILSLSIKLLFNREEEIKGESENEIIIAKREDRKRKSKESVGLCLIPYDESASEEEDEERRKDRPAKQRCKNPDSRINDDFDVDNALETAVDQKVAFIISY